MVYLDGEEPDLDYLRRQFTVPELSALDDENGTYLRVTVFDACATAHDVREVVEPLITRLDGMGTVASAGYRPVSYAGRGISPSIRQRCRQGNEPRQHHGRRLHIDI
jgi:hypothetical protein